MIHAMIALGLTAAQLMSTGVENSEPEGARSFQTGPTYQLQSERDRTPAMVVQHPEFVGRFDVVVDHDNAEGTVEVRLVGVLEEYLGHDQPIEADIRLEYPVNQNPVERVGNGRSVETDEGTALFVRDALAPNAAEWTNLKHPEYGSIAIRHAPDRADRLPDSVMVSLYHDLIAPEGSTLPIRGVECTPTLGECIAAARETCKPFRVENIAYSCDDDLGVTCNFTSSASTPE